jgi:Flp pilus assembly protein TadB
MSDVMEAQRRALQLVSHEMRAGVTTETALKVVARKCGVSYRELWALRYRAPKRIFHDLFVAIEITHEAMREQQARKLEHDLHVAEARGVNTDLARSIGGVSRIDRP